MKNKSIICVQADQTTGIMMMRMMLMRCTLDWCEESGGKSKKVVDEESLKNLPCGGDIDIERISSPPRITNQRVNEAHLAVVRTIRNAIFRLQKWLQ